MPCHYEPLSPISAEPAGVPNPQGAVDFCFFFFLYLYSRVRQFTPPQSRGLSRLPHPRREPFQRYLHTSQLWRSLVDFMVFSMGLGIKRAFRRARNRVAQAGPDGHTWYRGRRCSAADLGLLRSRSSIVTPLHSARARKTVTRASLPCLRLPAWPPAGDPSTTYDTRRQRGLLSVLSLNLGGLTQHGYDELCTWLHTPSVRDQVDVICLQETWRLGSEYLLPDWYWISSGSAPVSGQGVAILVNRRFVSDQTVRFREVQVGRILHVVVPLQHCGGTRSLDVVCVYMPSKVSESQSTYDRRDRSWTLVRSSAGLPASP